MEMYERMKNGKLNCHHKKVKARFRKQKINTYFKENINTIKSLEYAYKTVHCPSNTKNPKSA
jgi:hypothetical protein